MSKGRLVARKTCKDSLFCPIKGKNICYYLVTNVHDFIQTHTLLFVENSMRAADCNTSKTTRVYGRLLIFQRFKHLMLLVCYYLEATL